MIKVLRTIGSLLIVSAAMMWNLSPVNAQTVSDLEDFNLNGEPYYNGSDEGGSFISNGVEYSNRWDTAWGGFWADGFAVSTKTDDTTGTFNDPYSTYAGTAMGDSGKFVVGLAQQFYKTNVKIPGGSEVAGMYVTNTTYAALSMLNGDAFGKKFGSDSNAAGVIDSTWGKDWFKLTIDGYFNGAATSSVDFYLADYRFEDDSKDYIIKDWTWVDLRGLGTVDSIRFYLNSSDFSGFGINTPGYFCMDNFTLLDSVTKTSVDTSICPGSSAMILGNPQTEGGIWFDTITADSVVAYNLEIYPATNVYVELPETMCEDSMIDLTLNTMVDTVIFSGNGVSGSSFDASDSAVTIGVNSIMVSYTDVNGCEGITSGMVEVLECGGVNIGTNEKLSDKIVVYPSVTEARIFIQAGEWKNYSVRVMDLNGSVLQESSDSPKELSLEHLSKGFYLVEIVNERGRFVAKIVRK